MFYSRSENKDKEKEVLSVHLEKTAELAGRFADSFGEATAGKCCGLLHDVGKASDMFQGVLDKTEHNVNHEAAGAHIMYKPLPLLARVIYAHHKGLLWNIETQLDRSLCEKGSCESRPQGRRFSVSGKEQYLIVKNYIHTEIALPKEKPKLTEDNQSFYKALPTMLHARMLLSCLVDADYTASASHDNKDIYAESTDDHLDADKIILSLEKYKKKIKEASKSNPQINKVRDEVYRDCVNSSAHDPGLFTITAPTGTGKTLALLAFAAYHARKFGKERIIIVLPFLSIINQNASIYKEICGNVLEAHSMASYNEQTRLYAERWTSPVIITTSVKFFEALFKCMPTDLRFLHSIANSVIVFDEAQVIPAELSGTTIESLNSLCKMFHCSVVLSTATQPDYSIRKDIDFKPQEIIHNPTELYNMTRRVRVQWDWRKPIGLDIIAEKMAQCKNACCVVNRKDHAYKLFNFLKQQCCEDECFFISTDMCKGHRDKAIMRITKLLKNDLPCRLVSTSCIEAGVDLDFTNMFRALAPLDSIIQCAGRCNRNGRNDGVMIVFEPDEEKLYPSNAYYSAVLCVKLILTRHEIDINSPEHINEYYNELFSKFSHDKEKLCTAIENKDFEEVERQYKLIDSSGANVLVPYKGEIDLFNQLAQEAVTTGITKSWMKRAAPITVTCYRRDKLDEICERSAPMHTAQGLRESPGNWYVLNDKRFYKDDSGLHFEDDDTVNYLL